jgi:hypothetical protein
MLAGGKSIGFLLRRPAGPLSRPAPGRLYRTHQMASHSAPAAANGAALTSDQSLLRKRQTVLLSHCPTMGTI